MPNRPATAGDRRKTSFDSIKSELDVAGVYAEVAKQPSVSKKNFAETLSRGLATRFAGALRKHFKGILPTEDGQGQESRARSSKRFKKLDVNYSTPDLGLGLGVSIKTINFKDAASARYTKNYTRVDAELRAEASDFHDRQPYAVMIAVVFLPIDACEDGAGASPSSFGMAVQIFRQRGGRDAPDQASTLFERVYVGLYESGGPDFGRVGFFDVRKPPPKNGRPAKLLTLAELVTEIVATYDARNYPSFEWADEGAEKLELPDQPDLSEPE